MKITYQYRIKPTKQQIEIIEDTIEKLRYQYNYLLADRFNWWEQNRCYVNSCPLVCHLPKLINKPNYHSQQSSLPKLKNSRPWYKTIHSQVLQDCVKRVEKTFDRWLACDSKGNRSGRPRFKGRGRYRIYTYTQFKHHNFSGKSIKLSKLGDVKVIYHRVIPDGFTIKRVSVTRKADGYYISLFLEDNTVPVSKFYYNEKTIQSPISKVVGVDVGLKDFAVCSDGKRIQIPQFYRKAESKLKWAQRKLSRTKKGSKRRRKAINFLGRKHKKVADCRKNFHNKAASYLLSCFNVVVVEKLNVKGLAKSKLAKSIHDAGWATFINILENKAAKAGLLIVKVDARNTSKTCSNCSHIQDMPLSERVYSCPSCKTQMCRDKNAALNIKARGTQALVKNAQSNLAIAGVLEKPTVSRQGAVWFVTI